MFLFCLVFAMFCARLFICASWSPAGKGRYLIVSIPDLCNLTYFYERPQHLLMFEATPLILRGNIVY